VPLNVRTFKLQWGCPSTGGTAWDAEQPTQRSFMAKPKPPVSLLWEKYAFNPFTGRFHCIFDDYEYRGNLVGKASKSHQLSISGNYRYPYGVCVYAWFTGKWPEPGNHVDHIDRNPFNHCRWNIREVTPLENMQNRRRSGRLPKEKFTTKRTGTGKWRTQFSAPTLQEAIQIQCS
jgi:hypothetical protein